MSKAFTPTTYLDKADRALIEARLPLDAGATEGACNRAYYAMFDAAHGALSAIGSEAAGADIKTHTGLITMFSKDLVQTNRVESLFAKSLNQVQQLRLIADYTAEAPNVERAAWAVEQAATFVEKMRQLFVAPPSTDGPEDG